MRAAKEFQRYASVSLCTQAAAVHISTHFLRTPMPVMHTGRALVRTDKVLLPTMKRKLPNADGKD